MIDLARFLNGEIATVSGLRRRRSCPGGEVDDAIEAAVEFENGAVGTIESTRFALGRRNAFQWEINGSKGSLAFDMERLNELQVFRADGDRARGFKTVLVSEANHPFWEHWWPPGHIIGWGDTFVHELHHMLAGDRLRRRRRAVRRDVRGRLPRRPKSATRSCARRRAGSARRSPTARSDSSDRGEPGESFRILDHREAAAGNLDRLDAKELRAMKRSNAGGKNSSSVA